MICPILSRFSSTAESALLPLHREAEPPYHIRGKEEERSHGAILAPLDMQLQGVAAEDAVEIRGWCKNNLAGFFTDSFVIISTFSYG